MLSAKVSTISKSNFWDKIQCKTKTNIRYMLFIDPPRVAFACLFVKMVRMAVTVLHGGSLQLTHFCRFAKMHINKQQTLARALQHSDMLYLCMALQIAIISIHFIEWTFVFAVCECECVYTVNKSRYAIFFSHENKSKFHWIVFVRFSKLN